MARQAPKASEPARGSDYESLACEVDNVAHYISELRAAIDALEHAVF